MKIMFFTYTEVTAETWNVKNDFVGCVVGTEVFVCTYALEEPEI